MARTVLRFHGAAGGVTGSCYEIESAGSRILVDCGLFQGSKSERELNYGAFPFDPRAIDAVILTHAHIDHSGLLPKLVRQGFSGPIHTSGATIDLCSVMLQDSAHIQETEVEQLNRRNARRGRAAVSADLYGAGRRGLHDPVQGRRVRRLDADLSKASGHASGMPAICSALRPSNSRSCRATANRHCGCCFPAISVPARSSCRPRRKGPQGVDYLVCESTYGDRDRPEMTREKRRALLGEEVRRAVEQGGPLIIPSFAVERTQELLVDLFLLAQEGTIPSASIFVDSPLATRASAIFERHAGDIEGGETLRAALTSGDMRFTETVDQSKAINRLTGFYIVIAASGMCDAGRIRHHLRANLWRRNATVMMAGFQAQGSLGRILLDGASRVRIQGDEIEVKARITSFDYYSGHADAGELVDWVRARGPVRHAVFLTHGEEAGLKGLRAGLSGVLPDERRVIPRIDDAFELGGSGFRQIDLNARRRLLAGTRRAARLAQRPVEAPAGRDRHGQCRRRRARPRGDHPPAAPGARRGGRIGVLPIQDGSKPAVNGWT